ncbi:MAG: alpha/beta hydrolase [Aeoliella sp.]
MKERVTRRPLSHRLWRFLRAPILAYLLVVLLMTFLETWLVYPIPPVSRANWNPVNLGHEDIWFESEDGTRLHGWLFAHDSPQHAVLYCHGNGEQVADNAQLMAFLRDHLDATVFIFDYRGYGKSDGRPHEAGVVADGKAAHKWLAEREGVATENVVLMGRSIGGGVVIASAAENGAKALVLQNTFARMVDTAAKMYPWLPVRLVMKNRYDSIARIASYLGPVLQSHGTADQLVPVADARVLFETIPTDRKQFIEQPGHTHNSEQPAHYYDELRVFLDAQNSGRK